VERRTPSSADHSVILSGVAVREANGNAVEGSRVACSTAAFARNSLMGLLIAAARSPGPKKRAPILALLSASVRGILRFAQNDIAGRKDGEDMRFSVVLVVAGLVFALVLPSLSQNSRKKAEPEQSSFGGEEVPGIPFIKRPVPIPPAVLEILKQDDTVKGCLSDNEPTREKPFSSWFVASGVHLDGPNEGDLVVLPSPEAGPSYPCFHSASGIQRLWVFRNTAKKYNLVLTTFANGIVILKPEHSGRRDIQGLTAGSAGRFITTIFYRFDGSQYQKYQEQTTEQK